MQVSRRGYVLLDQSPHASPLHLCDLAAPGQNPPPVSRQRAAKRAQAAPIPRDRMVVEIALDNPLELFPGLRNPRVHPTTQLLLYFSQLLR